LVDKTWFGVKRPRPLQSKTCIFVKIGKFRPLDGV
jgi:hypothetical protein